VSLSYQEKDFLIRNGSEGFKISTCKNKYNETKHYMIWFDEAMVFESATKVYEARKFLFDKVIGQLCDINIFRPDRFAFNETDDIIDCIKQGNIYSQENKLVDRITYYTKELDPKIAKKIYKNIFELVKNGIIKWCNQPPKQKWSLNEKKLPLPNKFEIQILDEEKLKEYVDRLSQPTPETLPVKKEESPKSRIFDYVKR
jgi:hypothetical protein